MMPEREARLRLQADMSARLSKMDDRARRRVMSAASLTIKQMIRKDMLNSLTRREDLAFMQGGARITKDIV